MAEGSPGEDLLVAEEPEMSREEEGVARDAEARRLKTGSEEGAKEDWMDEEEADEEEAVGESIGERLRARKVARQATRTLPRGGGQMRASEWVTPAALPISLPLIRCWENVGHSQHSASNVSCVPQLPLHCPSTGGAFGRGTVGEVLLFPWSCWPTLCPANAQHSADDLLGIWRAQCQRDTWRGRTVLDHSVAHQQVHRDRCFLPRRECFPNRPSTSVLTETSTQSAMSPQRTATTVKLSRNPSVPHPLHTRGAAKTTRPAADRSSPLTPLSTSAEPIAESNPPADLDLYPHSPTPPPRRSGFSSSSDSESSPPCPLMLSQSKLATVEICTGKLPTVHVGEITPLVATQFKHAMLDYAAAKDIPSKKLSSLVFGCFLDQRVRNWFNPNGVREAFAKLTLTKFMAKLRKKFLHPDWEVQTCVLILSHHMKDDQTFSEWVVILQSLQALLVGTNHKISDQRLHHTIEANMLPDLERDYSKHKTTNAIPEDEFDTSRQRSVRLWMTVNA
ncbi:hypothetical protein B0H10DRAFT_1941777 [Mycena sp. CBHHK59/15]|nr:hypothetical protein B0H10DRAFT_1941777 [Mycena sp. CBHHK59/15]